MYGKQILSVLIFVTTAVLPVSAKKKSILQEPVKPVVELISAEDSASYALGISMGSQVKDNLSKEGYSIGLFYEAFSSSLSGEEGLMDKASADEFLDKYQKSLYERALDSLKRDQVAFLEDNALQEGVKVTDSGLQYRVIRMGDGARPKATDRVKVTYVGSLITGRIFDSQTDTSRPVELALDRVIQGWSEGLQLMPVGSKFILYIPSELGYGERGAGNVIPPYATLIFEVELLDIAKN